MNYNGFLSPGPHLPRELTDHVIQNLHSEPEALANCALVCRSWAPAAQSIILSKISIHERNCADIIEHLTSTTPHIVGYVKRLAIFLWGDLRSNLNRSTANMTPLLHLLLPHISRFTNITELALDGCRAFHDLQWDEIWTDLLASAFPSLSRLTVHYLTFEDLADLVDLVSSFPLTHLTADDLDIAEASHEYSNEEQEPYEGPKTPPPHLESIKYTSGRSFASGCGPFLRWLAAGPQGFSTLYLDLDAEAGDVNAGVELIGAANDHLKTLFLSFDDQWHLWGGLRVVREYISMLDCVPQCL
ncbi:F-box domain-containing protein [Mycena venus]|uniref:F-box domain-containing protein n=1 Tax=Mycena venus TaxID=2733690 RepID=A0A8H6XCI9_9AGAR|nr:F-box domain-containing protein [Mycena venus]